MEKITCDGKFSRDSQCENKAKFIARSNIDPIACVYYCCEEHKDSYAKEEFIIEEL